MNRTRIQKIVHNMEDEGLEQIIIYSKESIYYISGVRIDPGERLLLLYLDKNGEAIFFANELFDIEQQEIPVIWHKDGQNPVKDLCETIKSGRLGVDDFLPSKFLFQMTDLRKDVIPVQGSLPINRARLIKDAEEIDRLCAASSINDGVMGDAVRFIRHGITEKELMAEINRSYLIRGAKRPNTHVVAFGEHASNVHHGAGNRAVKAGDCILMDIFIPINKYWCDMTRTVFYKTADKEASAVYETVRRANDAGKKAVRPGQTFASIDRAARGVIEEAGYGAYFSHRTGHNIGLQIHEPPDVIGSTQTLLAPGMVFSVEPGIYLPGKMGVRIEDLVLVTDTGYKELNQYSHELTIV